MFCLVLDVVVSMPFLFEKPFIFVCFVCLSELFDVSEFRLSWWSQFDRTVLFYSGLHVLFTVVRVCVVLHWFVCAVLYCSSVFKGIHCRKAVVLSVDSVLFLTQTTVFFYFLFRNLVSLQHLSTS